MGIREKIQNKPKKKTLLGTRLTILKSHFSIHA